MNEAQDGNIVDQFQQWPASRYADPIAVEHGIKLQKSLAEIARNWWSQRWLSIIEAFGLGIRLERAKLYATRGQIVSIEIENGIVKSFVQGAEKEPYRVIIAVKTIPQIIWRTILQDLAANSHFAICLSSKTLPRESEVEAVFSNNGVLLFPDRQGEMQTKCSCLDWSNPCKHIAAVYLLLAAEFDRDPFLIFKLRGLNIDSLFSLLNPATKPLPDNLQIDEENSQASISNKELTDSPTNHEQETAQKSAMEEMSKAQIMYPRRFWKKSITANEISCQWAPPAETAALPASLGDFPFWQGKDSFLTSVHLIYENAPAHAMQLLK